MKTLRKSDIETMERELKVLVNPERILGGAKGDWDDPYTQEEWNSMLESGTWTTGGFVDGMGYVAAEVIITGSTSGSGSAGVSGNNGSPSGNNSSTDWEDFFDSNSWIVPAALDFLSTIDSPAGYIITGTATVNDIWNYYNGNMSSSDFQVSMAKNIVSLIPIMGNTLAHWADTAAKKIGEFEIELKNYFYKIASGYYYW